MQKSDVERFLENPKNIQVTFSDYVGELTIKDNSLEGASTRGCETDSMEISFKGDLLSELWFRNAFEHGVSEDALGDTQEEIVKNAVKFALEILKAEGALSD